MSEATERKRDWMLAEHRRGVEARERLEERLARVRLEPDGHLRYLVRHTINEGEETFVVDTDKQFIRVDWVSLIPEKKEHGGHRHYHHAKPRSLHLSTAGPVEVHEAERGLSRAALERLADVFSPPSEQSTPGEYTVLAIGPKRYKELVGK